MAALASLGVDTNSTGLLTQGYWPNGTPFRSAGESPLVLNLHRLLAGRDLTGAPFRLSPVDDRTAIVNEALKEAAAPTHFAPFGATKPRCVTAG
jgi:hypothetical protein